MLSAKSADEIAPMVPKADRDKLKSVPAEGRGVFLDMHRDWAQICGERPKVTRETISGDSATLEAATTCAYTAPLKSTCLATVTLEKETDGWKVKDRPKWQRQKP